MRYAVKPNLYFILFLLFQFVYPQKNIVKTLTYNVIEIDNVLFSVNAIENKKTTEYFLIIDSEDSPPLQIDEATLKFSVEKLPELFNSFSSDSVFKNPPNQISKEIIVNSIVKIGYSNFTNDKMIFWWVTDDVRAKFSFLNYEEIYFPLSISVSIIENLRKNESLNLIKEQIKEWAENRIPEWIKNIEDPKERHEMMKTMGYE